MTLWENYSVAANKHVDLIRAHTGATEAGDDGRCNELEPMIEEAAKDRLGAWVKYRAHRSTPHTRIRSNVYRDVA